MRSAYVSILFSLAIAALATGCSREPTSHEASAKPSASVAQAAPSRSAVGKPIGKATMKPDGTIVLDLYNTGPGPKGGARFTYPPGHPDYEKVDKHIGGIKKGEERLVPPWPSK